MNFDGFRALAKVWESISGWHQQSIWSAWDDHFHFHQWHTFLHICWTAIIHPWCNWPFLGLYVGGLWFGIGHGAWIYAILFLDLHVVLSLHNSCGCVWSLRLDEACDHVQWRYLCWPNQLDLHHWRRATNLPELHRWWDDIGKLFPRGFALYLDLHNGHGIVRHAPNSLDDATSSQPCGQLCSHNCLGRCICPGSHLGQRCVLEDAGSWHYLLPDYDLGIRGEEGMGCEP